MCGLTGFFQYDSWLRLAVSGLGGGVAGRTTFTARRIFNPRPIRQKWVEYLNGQRSWQYHLWDVLIFQTWMEASR